MSNASEPQHGWIADAPCAKPRNRDLGWLKDPHLAVATDHGACVRPVLRKVHDRRTGEVHKLVIPCGSTREHLCPPCAKKAQRLRMQQREEGWHLQLAEEVGL